MIKENPADTVDVVRYAENRRRFPQEELDKHAGLYVAFNADASAIVASAPEREELFDKLEAMGIPGNTVVFDWIPFLG